MIICVNHPGRKAISDGEIYVIRQTIFEIIYPYQSVNHLYELTPLVLKIHDWGTYVCILLDSYRLFHSTVSVKV
jgi:hypothetical protein